MNYCQELAVDLSKKQGGEGDPLPYWQTDMKEIERKCGCTYSPLAHTLSQTTSIAICHYSSLFVCFLPLPSSCLSLLTFAGLTSLKNNSSCLLCTLNSFSPLYWLPALCPREHSQHKQRWDGLINIWHNGEGGEQLPYLFSSPVWKNHRREKIQIPTSGSSACIIIS